MAMQPAPTAAPEERPLKPALWRGWCKRCPNCGKGRILYKYLKVRDACPVCGEAIHHHRADDRASLSDHPLGRPSAGTSAACVFRALAPPRR